MQTLTLIQPDDFHVHFRDGAALQSVVPHTARQMARALVMPNLKPPITTVAQALAYRDQIQAAVPQGNPFEPLMSLYLTDHATPELVRQAKAAGIVAFKLYPAGATTHSDSGVTDLFKLLPVLHEMAAQNILLLAHGEVTDPSIDIFDREAAFIERVMQPIGRQHRRHGNPAASDVQPQSSAGGRRAPPFLLPADYQTRKPSPSPNQRRNRRAIAQIFPRHRLRPPRPSRQRKRLWLRGHV